LASNCIVNALQLFPPQASATFPIPWHPTVVAVAQENPFQMKGAFPVGPHPPDPKSPIKTAGSGTGTQFTITEPQQFVGFAVGGMT
jgi:hypothetical protein